jgi:hypothetical protein
MLQPFFYGNLEVDCNRENKGWGWVYVVGLFVTNVLIFLIKFFQIKIQLFERMLPLLPPPSSGEDGNTDSERQRKTRTTSQARL